jgi:hypothetical protein
MRTFPIVCAACGGLVCSSPASYSTGVRCHRVGVYCMPWTREGRHVRDHGPHTAFAAPSVAFCTGHLVPLRTGR